MDNQNIQQLRLIVDIIDRKKKFIITCILVAATIGLLFYLKQPKLYQSTTLLSYQQQEVLPDKMSPGTEAKINDIVSTVSQLVTSRTSLEKIINDEKLYAELIQTLPMEDVVEIMRKNITIVPSRKGDTFKISFTGSIPGQVVRVTNALSARFIEENLKFREEKASDTSTYTQEELDMAKEMLHYNEMPDQRDSNINRMIALQGQYQQKQDSIQDLQRTKVLVREQIAAQDQLIELGQNNTQGKILVVESPQQKLNRLAAELSTLQQRYTEQHPKIKRLQQQIALLQAEVEKNAPETNGVENETEVFNKALFDLRLQIKGIDLNIEKLTKEGEVLKKLIEECENWVEATPIREAEWTALTREYDQMKARYDFLVSQNLKAKSMLNLERKQKGSQFKIEDSARKPIRPIQPKFYKIMMLALLGGFGVGAAVSLGLELVDSSFRNSESLENALGIEVICTIPRFSMEKEIKKRQFFNCGIYTFFILWFIVLSAGMFYLWGKGKIII